MSIRLSSILASKTASFIVIVFFYSLNSLSREILSGESVGHKDELKIAFTLGTALLKSIGLNLDKDKEFLSKIDQGV